MQGKHVARARAARSVGFDEPLQALGFGSAPFDDGSGIPASLLLGGALLREGGLHHVGFESPLFLQSARLLAFDFGLRLRDDRGDGAALLADQCFPPARRVGDALLRLLPGDLEIGFGLRDFALRPVRGLLNGGVRAGFGFCRCLLHVERRAADAADAREVVHLVRDVLDLQRVEHESHAAHVVLGLFEQRIDEAEFVLVELLGRETREHAAQVPLERLLGDVVNFLARSAEKALGRVREQRLFAGELHVRDALNRERDAAFGEGALDVDVHREHAEVEHVDAFDERAA